MTILHPKSLRPFQEKVRDLVLADKNVLLQAPTGSGKTLAALQPFIENVACGGAALPHSCLYAIPLRVLATQFSAKFQTIPEWKGKIDYQQFYERLGKPLVAIQTGEQPDDPQFESLLTICTIDQLLASSLGAPFSIGRRKANLNVGAVLGSYLVLDEFHLYPLRDEESCFGARTTTLAMLSLLQGITPFVLMSATLSRGMLEQLKKLLNAEIVTPDDEELEQISQGRQRFFEVAYATMSAESILARHDQCSLVICNTVLRAQQRYWELKDLAQQRGIEVILLHSRLTDEDRTKRSKMVIDEIGPESWRDGAYRGRNLIVVATQVVEVGLDISVQTLHTEIAPANSLIQRAGRCARFAQQEGHVIVYDLPPKDGKPASPLPYEGKLCQMTLSALRQFDPSKPFGSREEQDLIDAVHTEEDQILLDSFAKRRDIILENIFTSLRDHKSEKLSTLIRNVVQVQVLIHNDPDEAIKEKPWHWQNFALHPGSLASRMKFFEEKRGEFGLDWLCKEAIADGQNDTEEDSRNATRYKWSSISYIEDAKAMERALLGTIMIALPSALATYHPELGFIFRDDWGKLLPQWPAYQSTLLLEREDHSKKGGYKIVRRSYQEHIQGLVHAYNNGIAQQIAYTASRLEALLELPPGSVDHAIRLAIACHDLGKLSNDWQQWALKWQQLLYQQMQRGTYQHDPNFFFAKTDFDSQNPDQQEWQRQMKKRPNHACESVALAKLLISDSFGITSLDNKCYHLWHATCGAIARHHTPTASKYQELQLKPGALAAIKEALELARQNQPWAYDLKQIKTTQLKGRNLQSDSYLTQPQQGQLEELET